MLTTMISMGVAANSPPNFAATEASFGPAFGPGPVHTYAGTPPAGAASGGSGFVGSLNGLNQAVYSYGGAMLFISFLAEMRHPWDFWKGILCPYNWQTATNIMNIITGLIAAALYGNIGIKVAYIEVFQGIFNAPPLTTKAGKWLWVALVPAYVRNISLFPTF